MILEGQFYVGDTIYLDPFAIPELKIITKEEADKIAKSYPASVFVVTGPVKKEFKTFTDYVKHFKKARSL